MLFSPLEEEDTKTPNLLMLRTCEWKEIFFFFSYHLILRMKILSFLTFYYVPMKESTADSSRFIQIILLHFFFLFWSFINVCVCFNCFCYFFLNLLPLLQALKSLSIRADRQRNNYLHVLASCHLGQYQKQVSGNFVSDLKEKEDVEAMEKFIWCFCWIFLD